MSWLADTAALYARVFRDAAVLTARSWILVVAVMVYTVVLQVSAVLVQSFAVAWPLAIVGGVAWTIVLAACLSSWLGLTERVIRAGRAGAGDILPSFAAYLGDLLTVGFLLFGLRLLAGILLAGLPFLQIVFGLAMIVFFNAVPELLYLGRYTPAELLVASYRFIGENWVEWFPPTLLIGAVVGAVGIAVPAGPYGLVVAAAVGAVASYGWVVRGLLFLALTTSGRRAREFQRRAAR